MKRNRFGLLMAKSQNAINQISMRKCVLLDCGTVAARAHVYDAQS